MAPTLDLSRAHLVDGSQWKPTQKRAVQPDITEDLHPRVVKWSSVMHYCCFGNRRDPDL